MKSTYMCIFLLLGVWLCSACVDDKGSYDYIELNDLTIQEFETSYTVEQFTHLQIPVTITARDDKFDAEAYTYKWVVYSQHNNLFTADTLSTEKDLDVEITKIPGEYRLYYEVTDKATDVIYTQETSLTVINSYSIGLMVLSRVEDEAQLTFINKASTVIEDAYEKVNGEPVGKNPVGVRHITGMLSRTEPMVVIMTNDERGGTVVAPLDLSYVMDFRDMFYFPPASIKPQAFGTSDYTMFEYVINDGAIYTRPLSVEGGYSKYGVKIKGDYDFIAPFDFFSAVNPQIAFFYDQGKERFVSMDVPLQGESVVPLSDVSGSFNPNNMGMKMLWGGLFGTEFAMTSGRAVMEDHNGVRHMIAFAVTSGEDGKGVMQPQYKYELTSEGIERAVSFTTSQGASFLYYATRNKIVCCSFATGNLMSVYEFPEGQQVDCIECDQKNNPNHLWVGLSDGSAMPNTGSVVILEMSTDGSLTEVQRFEHVCGQIVDFEYKK